MNGQSSPNQGIAQLMGGSSSLGGDSQKSPQAPQAAPQSAPQMPQAPQPTPQGGLPPDLLKALAMARVKKLQDAAKRDLELQMAQQQAASGEDKKTVVQQMQEGVEKEVMDETQQALVRNLSGGIKQEAQQSAQPMAGGIASAPGANQAAQPEAMASGGIVAFASGAGGNKNKGPIPAAILQDEEGFYKEPGSDLLISEEDRQPVAATLQPKPRALSGLPAILEKQITQEPSGDAEMAKYQKMVAVDPELAAQLKADTAAERAALQAKATREPSVYDKLREFANVAPRGGQTWTMAGAQGAGNINKLEKEYENERLAALGGLRSLSKADLEKRQAEQKEAYGISKGEKTEQRHMLEVALTEATKLYGNDSTTMASLQAALSKNPLEIEFYANNYLESQRAKGDNRDKSIIKNEGIIKFVEAKAKTEVGKGGIAAQLQGVQTRADVDREQQKNTAYSLAVREVNDLEQKGFSPVGRQLSNAKRDDKKNGTNTYKEIKDRLINEIYLKSPAMQETSPGTPAQSAPSNTNRTSPGSAVDFNKLPK